MQASISLLILGVVQGLTEFLPVSSTGHLILARSLLGMNGGLGLAEDAVLHLATALAVLVYFRKDIWGLVSGLVSAVRFWTWNKEMTLITALLVGTIPAVLAGLWLESDIETVFRSPLIVAGGLVVGSLLMLFAEYIEKRSREAKEITVRNGFIVGLFQTLALIPGMSRSGMTISGGMFLGLSRAEAARFAFLLSFPVILGAGGLKFAELSSSGVFNSIGVPLLLGGIAAFVSGMFAIHTLISFLKTKTLTPFIVYRFALALAIAISVLI